MEIGDKISIEYTYNYYDKDRDEVISDVNNISGTLVSIDNNFITVNLAKIIVDKAAYDDLFVIIIKDIININLGD